MIKEYLRKTMRRMVHRPLFWSFAMHFAVILGTGINMSLFVDAKLKKVENPPIFIDLSKVEIAEITNLPVKTEVKKKELPKHKSEQSPPKPFYTPPKRDVSASLAQKTSSIKKIETKSLPKPEGARLETPAPQPEAPAKKKKEQKPKEKPKQEVKPQDILNDLGSLLSSIEEVKTDDFTPVNYRSDENKPKVSEGVKGGIGGDLSRKVSITDKDALISRIRSCWNVEAGVKGAEKIIVEIKARINRDGSVKSVDIVDKNRYNNDRPFRTIAESARRAIYICEKRGNDSPFYILAKKYPDTYAEWSDLRLRFSPLEGVGF